jgi:hypothetical protein
MGTKSGDAATLCRGSFVANLEVLPEDATTAAKLAKAALKLTGKVSRACAVRDVGDLSTCAKMPMTTGELVDCLLPAYGATANAAAAVEYGRVTAIAGTTKCQKAVGKAGEKYLTSITKAMHACLDRVNAGLQLLGDDAQTFCLGSQTEASVELPHDSETRAKLSEAEAKLRRTLTSKCGDPLLDPPPPDFEPVLDICGGRVTSSTDAGDCLACTHWRRAVDAIRSVYGPN